MATFLMIDVDDESFRALRGHVEDGFAEKLAHEICADAGRERGFVKVEWTGGATSIVRRSAIRSVTMTRNGGEMAKECELAPEFRKQRPTM